jgi:uncharacterized protein (TIGR03435 family)
MLVPGCLMVPAKSLAQVQIDSATSPRFEVASIKASNPSALRPGRMGSVRVVTTPGRLTARNAYLRELIKDAYGLEDYQISGGPGWIGSSKFDVEGKSTDGASRERLLLMLQALLADRFKLAFHRETKELPIYALIVAKNGPKFQSLAASQASCWPGCANSPSKTNVMRQRDLPSLATFLTRFGSDRPVIDKTGLAGRFALELDMSPILDPADGEQRPPTKEAMFESAVDAVQNKLGLKLVPTKAPIETFVIDNAQKPSEN